MLKPKEKTAGLNPGFLKTLEQIASELPFNLIITESVPTSNVGSHTKDSEHFSGLGVDVRAEGGYQRFAIVKAALAAGIKRIGVYDKHIHLGASTKLPHPVIWPGVSK